MHANGASEPLAIGEPVPLLITLGILDTVEQESLLLSIEGSADGATWRPQPLVTFPEKFYRGVSSVYIDPGPAGIRYVRASWKLNRWGRGFKVPTFRLYVFAEPVDDTITRHGILA